MAHASRVACGPLGLRGRRLSVHVRHAEPTADHQLGQSQRCEERAEDLGPLFEGGRVEHLAPDVGVHPHQLDAGQQLEGGDGLGGGTGGDGEAELGVLLPRAHEFVRVRLDTRRHSHEHPGPVGGRRRRLQQASEAGHLVEGVHDDPSDAEGEGGGQLLGRLVVAVEHQAVRRHAGREGHVELAARRDVEVHARVVGQAGHGSAQEGLGGVHDTLAPGGHGFAAGMAQVVLVVHEEWRAELVGQLEEVDAADVEVSLLVDGGAAWQQVAL